VLAAVISVMIAAIAVMVLRFRSFRPDLTSIGIAAVALVIAQGLVGAWVVYSGLALMATLSHAGLMALLFVILAEGIRRTWPRSSARNAATDTVRSQSPQAVTGD
jgi:heme A synthase